MHGATIKIPLMMFRVIVIINSPCMPTQGDSGGKLIFGGDSEKKSSYEHVSSSGWIARYSCLNLRN
jgi:hypothetical protein